MGFQPSKADFDLWIKDCGTHYEYIAQYVDDLAVCSKDPMALIKELETTYELKGVGTPVYYLGGDVLELDDAWIKEGITMATSAETYIKNAVERYERETKQTFGVYFCPMSPDYHSEEDDSPLLGPKDSSLYRGMLGSANWAVTLGRFDCAFAVNNLARYSMAPREGHLQAMMHVFGYLKKFRKGKLLIDPSKPDHSAYEVQEHNWSEMYPDAEEELPPDMPEPKGKSMNITVWVDADHASDHVTCWSVTGILLKINNSVVHWKSTRQKTVETSTYSSELVAARMATEVIIETRYKLRMLGIPVEGPAMLLGDNNSVILNTSLPSSTLKKKHQSISYHRVREAQAASILRFCFTPSLTNHADCLTKSLGNNAHKEILDEFFYRRPPNAPKDGPHNNL